MQTLCGWCASAKLGNVSQTALHDYSVHRYYCTTGFISFQESVASLLEHIMITPLGISKPVMGEDLPNNVCEYINDTLSSISGEGRLILSFGIPPPDQSLLRKTEEFWGVYTGTVDQGRSILLRILPHPFV